MATVSTGYDIMDRAGLQAWLREQAGDNGSRRHRLLRNLPRAVAAELTPRQRQMIALQSRSQQAQEQYRQAQESLRNVSAFRHEWKNHIAVRFRSFYIITGNILVRLDAGFYQLHLLALCGNLIFAQICHTK